MTNVSAEKLNAIYLTPQAPTPTSTSLILREVMFWSQNFEKILFLPSFPAALKVIDNGVSDVDLVLISNRFGSDDIGSFIKEAKALERGTLATFLVMLNATDMTDRRLLMSTFQTGADGIVFKPYSIEIIDQISSLSSKVKHQRTAAQRTATEILFNDSLVLYDPVASDRLEGKSARARLDYFRKTGSITLKLSPKNLMSYSAIASEELPDFRPVKCLVSANASSYLQMDDKETGSRDETLSESNITQFRAKMADSGMDTGFLELAIKRIRQSMEFQGIRCTFVDVSSQLRS